MRRKNLRKKFSFLILAMVFTMILVACSSSKSSTDAKYNGGTADYSEDMTAPEEAVGAEGDMNATAGVGDDAAEESAETADSSNSSINNENQKLIKTYSLDMETQDYDTLITTVQNKINGLGGYIESSNQSGNSYYDSEERYAEIVARIPKDKVEGFVNTVNKLGNVINRNENTKDVTLAYVDAQSHQKALKIEQERLLTLLEKAEKLEDIITLENRLSEVRYEIETYESTIRLYDNQVDYSTVSLTIREVIRMTVVDDDTAFDKMKSGLSNSLYNIKTGLVNLAIWFVVNLPYFIIWGVIILIVVFIVKNRINKRNKQIRALHKLDNKKEISNVEDDEESEE